MVAILGRYASRFSVRALDLTVDASLLWVGALLAVGAAVLLAFVPRLPSTDSRRASAWRRAACGSPGARARRLRAFAVTQIAASFVLLAGASMLLNALLALQAAQPGFDTRQVLALERARDDLRTDARPRTWASTRKRCGASASCRE